MIPIDEFLGDLWSMNIYIEAMFTQGDCYKLAKLLSKMYDGEILINSDGNHAAVKVDGDIYDINGLADNEGWRTPTDSEISMMENWDFQRRSILSLGECKVCEEPIIFEVK